ncbi:hypothetical protein QKT49_gp239 [Acanthamoeba castellanii medusavirus]|uniref:Uncharacterized protein n=1 Tax=Acanthamoeba castellanii medusavirus J1 TaxID=3114988 RepID=A0A3T1CXG6_9VIRU|nr:hypothetical protein QKT49_gp239 [Acanthamoeba castellanii medusavirus]BBI30524.1 hypothetical protein [Acanthamoeba castellanii medusavirus J1]
MLRRTSEKTSDGLIRKLLDALFAQFLHVSWTNK